MARCFEDKLVDACSVTRPYKTVIKSDLLDFYFFFPIEQASLPQPRHYPTPSYFAAPETTTLAPGPKDIEDKTAAFAYCVLLHFP